MKRFLVILVLLVLANVASAQDNPVLPDLAPRVVEITGDLTISFPSLRRQPLIGFNPPPQVPDIEPDRRPFAASYKQASADLPPSPLQPPEPPAVSTLAGREPYRSIVESGIGRYFDRYISANMSADLGSSSLVLLRGAYSGTSGYSPFTTDPSIETASNREFVDVGLRSQLMGTSVGIDASVSRSAYSLYGATPVPGALSQKNPSRIVTDVGAKLWIESRPAHSTGGSLALGFGRASVNTDVFDPAVRTDPGTERKENRMTLEGSIAGPFSDGLLQLDVEGSLQGLDESGFPGNTLSGGSASASYHFESADRFRTKVGVRVSGFDAVGQGRAGVDRSLVYISPDILVEYSIGNGIDLFFGDKPVLQPVSISDLHRLGPFLADEPAVQPVLTPTHLLTGIRASGDRFHASFQAGWKDVKNFRYAENLSTPTLGYARGYPIVGYENATVLYVETEITAVLSTGIQASARLAFRDGHLDDSDSVIPYFSPLTYGASFSVGLFEGLLLVQVVANGESSRFIDRAETAKVGSILNLSTEASYFLTDQAGITVGVRNLGSKRQFWDNYTPEGSIFYTGVRWRW